MFVVKRSSQNHKVHLMTAVNCLDAVFLKLASHLKHAWFTYFTVYFNFNFYNVHLSLFHAFVHYRCFFKSLESLLWHLQSSLGFWFLCCPYWFASCFYAATSCGHLETSSALNPLVSVFNFLLSNLRIKSSSVMFRQSVSYKFSQSDVDDCVYLRSYSSKSCILPSVILTARPLDHSCL